MQQMGKVKPNQSHATAFGNRLSIWKQALQELFNHSANEDKFIIQLKQFSLENKIELDSRNSIAGCIYQMLSNFGQNKTRRLSRKLFVYSTEDGTL
ncbi:hypothetical protein TNCT_326621 [Trichonephila clavata]|uniref:Uncharacterized protein n=1 Tax=Trichonephila clavata TaxID=2740835 RepID=A0A8X6KA85_TRICU|nr:hypothetical protein TNCT_326621 [Trichonephila clavata]